VPVSSQEVFRHRREGRLAEALDLARAEFRARPDDVWLLRAYGWVLYDHVKKPIDAFEAGELSASALSSRITPYMQEFSRMAEPLRRDMAFSQMLRLAGKACGAWRDFLVFARWAGVEDFGDEDKLPFVTDEGKTIDSLQTRFKRAICRQTAALAADPQADRALLSWGEGVLEEALKEAPNDQWLNYYQSKIHLARGEMSSAVERLAPVLRRQMRAAWPWALLGEILESARPEDAVTCYVHATQIAREEQEVAKARIRLAQLLARAGRFDEAAHQVDEALRYREKQGYKVPPDLAPLADSDWYRRAVAARSQRAPLRVSSAAAELLRELDRRPVVYTRGVIEHVNAAKALSYVATGSTEGIPLHHAKFPDVANHRPGTLVEVGRAEEGGPAVSWRLADAGALPGLYEARSGQLMRQEGQAFAFIRAKPEDVFVPPELAKQFVPGEPAHVSCWAVRRIDKKGKVGWRALYLTG
jgi:tetratricopeptide (TPR) repeat protein